jgi:hypothetical protein
MDSHNKLESFITVPRSILADLRSGKLSKPEFDALLMLRMQGSPYGIAPISLAGIADDLRINKNNATKLMLALKGKKYIHYDPRPGRRGSFEVHLDEWPTPRKDSEGKMVIKRLERGMLINSTGTALTTEQVTQQAEVQTEDESAGQRLKESISQVTKSKSDPDPEILTLGRILKTE